MGSITSDTGGLYRIGGDRDPVVVPKEKHMKAMEHPPCWS